MGCDVVVDGDPWGLSVRERQVAVLAACGLSVEEMSDALFVSNSTVKTYLARLFGKLRVRSRAHAVAVLCCRDEGFRAEVIRCIDTHRRGPG